MKAEKILEIINKIELNAEDRRYFESVKTFDSKELRKYPTAMNVIELLRREAETEIRTATAKTAGDAEKLKIADKMKKELASSQPYSPAEAAEPYRDESGRAVFGTAYTAVRLTRGIAGLDIRTERHPRGIDFARFINYSKTTSDKSLPLPSVSELTAEMKIDKANKKPMVYDAGAEYPLIDAQKLRDMLVLLSDEKRGIKPTANYKTELSNIYISSELGDGIICPRRRV